MRYLFLAVVLLLSFSASAQGIDKIKSSLSERSIDGARVDVVEDSSTQEAIVTIESQRHSGVVSGFRVVIFSDNGQYAGDNANSVLKGFRAKYPHIHAYLVYESPYFKISVGDCLSMEEAQILMAKILPDYPKAFPRREDIKLGAIKSVPVAPKEVVDSLNIISSVE